MEPMSDIRDMVIPDGIRETVSEDGAVLLDIEQGICFSLNPVGLKIWELLKKRYDFDRVVDALSRQFPVSREQLMADTREFVAALEAKRLIRRPQSSRKTSWLARLLPFAMGKQH